MESSIHQKSSFNFYLIFGAVVWLFFALIFSLGTDGILFPFSFAGLFALMAVFTLWLFVQFSLPHLLENQSTLSFVKSAGLLVFGSAIAVLLINILSIGFIPGMRAETMPMILRSFYATFFLFLLALACGAFVRILQHQLYAQKQLQQFKEGELEKQVNAKSQELNYLKSQIQPHFLFNTLNTIYGMSLTKSEKAPETILKLSSLLDYILYSVNKEKVPLANELKHIEQYISLEQIRFADSLKIEADFASIDENLMVPPMLFLPFVENAFKHGTRENGVLSVRMSVNIMANQIHFYSENSAKQAAENQNGIGLKNIKSRLNLLYADAHELTHAFENGKYIVNLKLDRN